VNTDLLRVRVGGWRIVFETVGADGTVVVHRIRPRGRAYDH
jgi:mRNA-degrading endonuclease RelE of RelBE toxin-antitoxin system